MAFNGPKEGLQNGAAVAAALDNALKMAPGVGERSARAIRLKNELNVMLELVVNIRERLEAELKDAVSAKFIDRGFVSKLKDLSQVYEKLTSSRIQLDKAERSMEAEMTPAQEKQAVRDFIWAMGTKERSTFIKDLWAWHLKHGGQSSELPDDWRAKYDKKPEPANAAE